MAHELPALPYAFDALEPHIDARTMEIHHDKHHATYVNKLNAALESHPNLQSKSLEDLLSGLTTLPDNVRGAVNNHGGGHVNHSTFCNALSPNGGGTPNRCMRSRIAANGSRGHASTQLREHAHASVSMPPDRISFRRLKRVVRTHQRRDADFGLY